MASGHTCRARPKNGVTRSNGGDGTYIDEIVLDAGGQKFHGDGKGGGLGQKQKIVGTRIDSNDTGEVSN